VASIQREVESQQNVFSKQSSDSSSALEETYCVTHLLAKESKLPSNREFIRK
jgi:hypothetical protein